MEQPNIFAIGDSHCIFFRDSEIIKNHWVGWGGMPVTMYTLNDQGLPLYNIVEEMPPGDICNINVKPNDFVLFYYGWNDVQKNISKYSGGNYESLIDSLVSKYLNLINAYKNGNIFSIRPIIACIYPIPLNTNESIVGSEEDRINYTL